MYHIPMLPFKPFLQFVQTYTRMRCVAGIMFNHRNSIQCRFHKREIAYGYRISNNQYPLFILLKY